MQLIPFTDDDYTLLISWIPNEVFNLHWGGPLYDWPLTIEDIERHQKCEEVTSFILESNGEKVGFIELVKESDGIYRLCRVLISEQTGRGRGTGKKLVKLALDYAQRERAAKKVKLGVFEHNLQAIKCYRSVGFQITASEKQFHKFNGQWWPLLRMEMVLHS
jgi:RimJ/RimL family protein N-acetyltransferase